MNTEEMTVNDAPERPDTAAPMRRTRSERTDALTLSRRDLRRMEKTEKRHRLAAERAERAARKGAGGVWQKWAEARKFNASRAGPLGCNRPG